ncbi:MAG TPA: hypothetical protein VGT82_06915, partial [Ktedonobacteraceae bacterium]|nr:hypothetical protein [Ktedonobacteraceae bacterium]
KLCELFGKSAEELGFMGELSLSNIETKPEETFSSSSKENNKLQNPPSFLAAYSTVPSESRTESVELTIQQDGKSQALPTRRDVLEIIGAATASLATPELFGTETLREFARILSKPSTLEEQQLSILEEKTAKLWKYRDDNILLPQELYLVADRHFQQMIHLLDGSLLPDIRTRLLAIASKTVTLNGAILYDLGMYEQSREHHRLAIQAAAQATQPILQAIAYAWMSFSWTYEQRYGEASNAITQAISLLTHPNEDNKTFAWLTSVAAEVYANLGNYDKSCSLLEQAESSLEAQSDQRHLYLHQFSDTQFKGFRGVCYQVLYHRKKPETHPLLEKSRIALEQALLDASASARQKQVYIADLASVYARQGEVEMACTLTKQAVDISSQATPKDVLQRLTEIQRLLQPWKETTYVKELDGFLRVIGII